MISFKNYCVLHEAKQVGLIHHFTDLDGLEGMLHTEPGKFVMRSLNGQTTSFTRSKNLPGLNPDFKNKKVRITFDGDKMSEHNKIKPIAGLKNNESDTLNHRHNSSNRVIRSSGEAEESLHKTDINLLQYIKHIHILPHGNEKYNKEVELYFSPKLSNLKIPHSFEKSFSFSDINENSDHYISFSTNYILI